MKQLQHAFLAASNRCEASRGDFFVPLEGGCAGALVVQRMVSGDVSAIALPGLRLQPLASYLSALGVLRLLNEQLDPQAVGWWEQGRFSLQTGLTAAEVEGFFLNRYAPTPMVSPWNGDGGFFSHGPDEPRVALEASTCPRLGVYRETLTAVDVIMRRLELDRPPVKEAKEQFVRTLHTELPTPAKRWLEAVFDLSKRGLVTRPLFFTGGNDGRFEVARNGMVRLAWLWEERRAQSSRELLRAALWDELASGLLPLTSGYLDPFSTAGLSSSSEGDGRQLSGNPWSYLLALEGALLLNEAAIVAEVLPVGQASLVSDKEQPHDLILPLWSEPLTAEALVARMKERSLPDTLRYARAQRNGRAHFAFPSAVLPNSAVPSRLDAPMRWLRERGLADRKMEEAALGYNQTSHRVYLTRFVEELGRLKLHGSKFPKPYYALVGLADDGSAEFALARALAGLSPDMTRFVGGDLLTRMRTLVRHRLRQAHQIFKRQRKNGGRRANPALLSISPAPSAAIHAFLCGEIDEARLERLLHALVLFDLIPIAPPVESAALLPLPYRLAKMAYHQAGDPRLAPREVEEALCRGDLDRAVDAAARFLQPRHPDLPLTWPRLPEGDGHRMAAALLFPISDALYRDLRKSVTGV